VESETKGEKEKINIEKRGRDKGRKGETKFRMRKCRRGERERKREKKTRREVGSTGIRKCEGEKRGGGIGGGRGRKD
jgi:hypothetical protein